jgi:hypothetical protein
MALPLAGLVSAFGAGAKGAAGAGLRGMVGAGVKNAGRYAVGRTGQKIRESFTRGKNKEENQDIVPVNVSVLEGFASAVKGSTTSGGGGEGGGGALVKTGGSALVSSLLTERTGDPVVDRLEEIKKLIQRLIGIETESRERVRQQILDFARDSERSSKSAEEAAQEASKVKPKKEDENPIVKAGKKTFGGIIDFIKGLVGDFIQYKILDWLSKPENKKYIQGTIQFFMNAFKFFGFIYDRFVKPYNKLMMEILGGSLNLFFDVIKSVTDLLTLKWLTNPKEFIDSLIQIPKTILEMVPNVLGSLLNFITLGFFDGAKEAITSGIQSALGMVPSEKPEGEQGGGETAQSPPAKQEGFNPGKAAGGAIKGVGNAIGTAFQNSPIGLAMNSPFGKFLGNAIGNTPIGMVGKFVGGMVSGKKDDETPQLREGGIVGPDAKKGNKKVTVKPLKDLDNFVGIGSKLKKTTKMFMDLLTMPFRLVGAALIALTMNTIGKIPGVGPFIKPLLQHIISKFDLPSSISNLVMGKSVDDKNQNKSKKSITSAKKPDSKSDGKRSVSSSGSGASPAPSSSGTPGVSGSPGSSGTPGVSGSPGSSGTPGVSGSPGSSGTPGVSGSPGSSGTPGTGAPGELLVTNAKTTYYDPSLGGINASGIKTKDGLPATSTGEGYKPNVFSAAAFPPLLAKLPKNMTVSAQGFPGGRTLKTPFNSIVTNSAGKKAVVRVNDVGPGVQGHESNHMLDFSVATKNYLGTGTGFSVALAQSGSQPGPLNTPGKKEGGWITGPQTGYPVSLDGGSSASFIGHGTEWVGMKKSAGGDVRSAFVIPFDTPSTRSNGGLTQRRMKEAKSGGYHLPGFQGGGKVKSRPASSTTGERTTDRGSDKGAGTGGLPAVITTGKLLLSKGFTVAEHPNFIKNSWSRPGPNTGTGYVSSGRASVGGHSSGSLHYKGLALDVTDWRDGDWPGRTKALAEEMYKNRNQLKLTQIIHDPWGSWFAGGAKGSGIGGHDTHLHLGFASGPGAENVDLTGGDSPDAGGAAGPTDSTSGGATATPEVISDDDLKYLYQALTGKSESIEAKPSTTDTSKFLSNVPNLTSTDFNAAQSENLANIPFSTSSNMSIVDMGNSVQSSFSSGIDTAELGLTLPKDGNWSIYKTNL